MNSVLLKVIAVVVCFVIYMAYIVLLAINGIEPSRLGGAIPAVILIWILRSVWRKITAMDKN